jgi:hypothetical protein
VLDVSLTKHRAEQLPFRFYRLATCIRLFQDRDQWWTLVNVIVILGVPQKALFFLPAGQLLVSCLGLEDKVQAGNFYHLCIDIKQL